CTISGAIAGIYSAMATYNGDGNYNTSFGSDTASVGKADQATLIVTSTTGTYLTPLTLTTSGGSGTGAVTYSVVNGTASGCAITAIPPFQLTSTSAGTCLVTATKAADANYNATFSAQTTVTLAQATPTAPMITNLPASGTYSGGFTATVSTTGDGTTSVTSNTPAVCTASGLTVSYVGVGTCSLTAQVAAGTDYLARSGSAQSFTVGRAVPSTPTITNIPSPANEFFGFTAIVGTNGDGTKSVTSNTPGVCSVGTNGLTVTFVGFGTCSLTPSVAQGSDYFGATGSPQTFPVNEASHGYWLVGSDGGIFSFGTAAFHGSMGGIPLQRPVVGITPTTTGNGYWLVASDGGIFSFGDATFYGSIPEVGLHPAGSGLPNSLNAPIVGMVPTSTGQGYFMVASDGGVFAFGDARFEGSCPGIGGCAGAAVAVMPDNTGKGYWLVTSTGGVYAFGDAPFYGASPPSTVPVVDAVATPDGHGYWLLYANGVVANFGDAGRFGGPFGYVDFYNPATAIFPTKDGLGYWVASARGDVFTYGVAPFLGGLAATGLNGVIIAGYGF
ncbi:MAG TPA: hypothetical protein VN799_06555, partial [Acidimicrobiales bacterium]|nr:hypothetical protein [Acidimicrobiales bacterium]